MPGLDIFDRLEQDMLDRDLAAAGLYGGVGRVGDRNSPSAG
jgi:hypothetical protein